VPHPSSTMLWMLKQMLKQIPHHNFLATLSLTRTSFPQDRLQFFPAPFDKLENSSIPVKPLTLIRDEWNLMIDLFNARKRGIRGSAIFTGSPGIGEHLLSSNSRSQLTDHRRQNLPFVLHPNPLHHQSPAGRVSRHGRGCLPYHRRGSIPNERRDDPRRSW
jgi:hypothetical protein